MQVPDSTPAKLSVSSVQETDTSDTKTLLPSLEGFIRLEGFSSIVPVTWFSNGFSPSVIIYGAATAEENTLLLAGIMSGTGERHTVLYKIDAETGRPIAYLEIDSRFGEFYGGKIFNAFPKPYGYLLTLSEGFLAVDFNLVPIKQVLFADLPGFDYLWISDGENFTDRYDVTDDFRYLVSMGQTYSVIDLEKVSVLVTRHDRTGWSIDLSNDYWIQPNLALAGDTLVGIGERWFGNVRTDTSEQGLYIYSFSENKKSFTPLSALKDILAHQAYHILDGGQTAEFRWDGFSSFYQQSDNRLVYRFSWPDMVLDTVEPVPPKGFPDDFYKQLLHLQTKQFCFLSLESRADPDSPLVNAFVCLDLKTNTQRAVVYPDNMRIEPVSVSPEGAVLVQILGFSGADGVSGVYILK